MPGARLSGGVRYAASKLFKDGLVMTHLKVDAADQEVADRLLSTVVVSGLGLVFRRRCGRWRW